MAASHSYEDHDLINHLASSNIPLSRIEAGLIEHITSAESPADEARRIKGRLADYLESKRSDIKRYTAKLDEAARAGDRGRDDRELIQRQLEGFHNDAQRTTMLLDRLERNPRWPESDTTA